MPQEMVRATIDIPLETYRQLERQAAQQGCSVEDLLHRGVDNLLISSANRTARRVSFPLIRSEGPKVDLTNDDIYERIEFP